MFLQGGSEPVRWYYWIPPSRSLTSLAVSYIFWGGVDAVFVPGSPVTVPMPREATPSPGAFTASLLGWRLLVSSPDLKGWSDHLTG